jgi:hypothetical protein
MPGSNTKVVKYRSDHGRLDDKLHLASVFCFSPRVVRFLIDVDVRTSARRMRHSRGMRIETPN